MWEALTPFQTQKIIHILVFTDLPVILRLLINHRGWETLLKQPVMSHYKCTRSADACRGWRRPRIHPLHPLSFAVRCCKKNKQKKQNKQKRSKASASSHHRWTCWAVMMYSNCGSGWSGFSHLVHLSQCQRPPLPCGSRKGGRECEGFVACVCVCSVWVLWVCLASLTLNLPHVSFWTNFERLLKKIKIKKAQIC